MRCSRAVKVGRGVGAIEERDLRLQLAIRQIALLPLVDDMKSDRNDRLAAEIDAVCSQSIHHAARLDSLARRRQRGSAAASREGVLGKDRIDFRSRACQTGASGRLEKFSPIHN
jgi:hypothetical protein